VDQDGWPDFLITRNNSTTLAYRNNGVVGRHSLRVVVRGAGGNPSAIGTKISAHYSDDSSQSAEISAGSGYYSQSSATCFFGSPDSNPLRSIEVRWPSGCLHQTGRTDAILDKHSHPLRAATLVSATTDWKARATSDCVKTSDTPRRCASAPLDWGLPAASGAEVPLLSRNYAVGVEFHSMRKNCSVVGLDLWSMPAFASEAARTRGVALRFDS